MYAWSPAATFDESVIIITGEIIEGVEEFKKKKTPSFIIILVSFAWNLSTVDRPFHAEDVYPTIFLITQSIVVIFWIEMSWIEEVDMTSLADNLETSRSIFGNQVPDWLLDTYEM